MGQGGQTEHELAQHCPGNATGIAPPRQLGDAHLTLTQLPPPPNPALLMPALLEPALLMPALLMPALCVPALLAPASAGAEPPRPALEALPPLLPAPPVWSSTSRTV
jgi:hypothetical protein